LHGLVKWRGEKSSTDTHPHYASVDEFRRFVELRDLRPRTREAYLSYVVLIGRHCGCDPATLDETRVRDYFLFLRNERNYAPSSIALTLAWLRTFHREHLLTGRDGSAEGRSWRISSPLCGASVFGRWELDVGS
jgi:hypothetical protein